MFFCLRLIMQYWSFLAVSENSQKHIDIIDRSGRREKIYFSKLLCNLLNWFLEWGALIFLGLYSPEKKGFLWNEHYAISQPRNPSIREFYGVQNCGSKDFKARKLRKVRSGKGKSANIMSTLYAADWETNLHTKGREDPCMPIKKPGRTFSQFQSLIS